jgi:hypothetical protein
MRDGDEDDDLDVDEVCEEEALAGSTVREELDVLSERFASVEGAEEGADKGTTIG